MNIFEQLSDIISTKQTKISDSVENEKEFIPYLTQRWISFYSDNFALLVNNTTNMMWKILDDKPFWYKMLSGILPKKPQKRIKYLKKNKEVKKIIDSETVEYLASKYEISTREVKEYIKLDMIDIKSLKRQLE